MTFKEWVLFRSNKEFADNYKLIRLNEDEEICFFISEASHAYCSNHVTYKISAAISNRGRIPSNNRTIYTAYIDINYDTNKVFLSDNVVNPECRNKGIGSLGLQYIKDFCKLQNCKSISGQKRTETPYSDEEMKILTHFYLKNDFQQLQNDMIKYEF